MSLLCLIKPTILFCEREQQKQPFQSSTKSKMNLVNFNSSIIFAQFHFHGENWNAYRTERWAKVITNVTMRMWACTLQWWNRIIESVKVHKTDSFNCNQMPAIESNLAMCIKWHQLQMEWMQVRRITTIKSNWYYYMKNKAKKWGEISNLSKWHRRYWWYFK